MKGKSSKIVVEVVIILLLVVIGLAIYPIIKRDAIHKGTTDYIVSQGYPVESISAIDIKHSYINRILGYNEWRIFVTFDKNPTIDFCFTYRNHEILFQGVSSNPMLDKDKVIEYSEKFKNGTLLDD